MDKLHLHSEDIPLAAPRKPLPRSSATCTLQRPPDADAVAEIVTADNAIGNDQHSPPFIEPRLDCGSEHEAVILMQRRVEEGDVHGDAELQSYNQMATNSERPADRGLHAWLFLAAAFGAETTVSSLVISFGTFEDYYRSHRPFKSHPKGISAIGTTLSVRDGLSFSFGEDLLTQWQGTLFLTISPCCYALHRLPIIRRFFPTVGVIIMALGLLIPSFCSELWELAIFLGVIHGLGAGMLYAFALSFLDEWFVARKGLAYGIMLSGSGFSGISVPWISSWSLKRFGPATVLRAWAVAVILLMSPFLYFFKPRISTRNKPPALDLEFVKHRQFILAAVCITAESMGFFLPFLYLLTHARSLGLDLGQQSVTISCINAGLVVGSVVFGKLTDHHDVSKLFAVTSWGAATSSLLLWGFATSYPAILVFALMCGCFAGSYSTVWTGVPIELRRENPKVKAEFVLSLFLFCRGVGAVASGPLGDSILRKVGPSILSPSSPTIYGTTFGGLVVATGVTAFIGGSTFLARRIKMY